MLRVIGKKDYKGKPVYQIENDTIENDLMVLSEKELQFLLAFNLEIRTIRDELLQVGERGGIKGYIPTVKDFKTPKKSATKTVAPTPISNPFVDTTQPAKHITPVETPVAKVQPKPIQKEEKKEDDDLFDEFDDFDDSESYDDGDRDADLNDYPDAVDTGIDTHYYKVTKLVPDEEIYAVFDKAKDEYAVNDDADSTLCLFTSPIEALNYANNTLVPETPENLDMKNLPSKSKVFGPIYHDKKGYFVTDPIVDVSATDPDYNKKLDEATKFYIESDPERYTITKAEDEYSKAFKYDVLTGECFDIDDSELENSINGLYNYLTNDQEQLIQKYYMWFSKRCFDTNENVTLEQRISENTNMRGKKQLISKQNILKQLQELHTDANGKPHTMVYAGYIDNRKIKHYLYDEENGCVLRDDDGKLMADHTKNAYCAFGDAIRFIHVAWDENLGGDCEDILFSNHSLIQDGIRMDLKLKRLANEGKCILFGSSIGDKVGSCLGDFFEVKSEVIHALHDAQMQALKDMEAMLEAYKSKDIDSIYHSFDALDELVKAIKPKDALYSLLSPNYEQLVQLPYVVDNRLLEFYTSFRKFNMIPPKSLVQEIRQSFVGWVTSKFTVNSDKVRANKLQRFMSASQFRTQLKLMYPINNVFALQLSKIFGNYVEYANAIKTNNYDNLQNSANKVCYELSKIFVINTKDVGLRYSPMELSKFMLASYLYLTNFFCYEITGCYKYNGETNTDEGGRGEIARSEFLRNYDTVATVYDGQRDKYNYANVIEVFNTLCTANEFNEQVKKFDTANLPEGYRQYFANGNSNILSLLYNMYYSNGTECVKFLYNQTDFMNEVKTFCSTYGIYLSFLNTRAIRSYRSSAKSAALHDTELRNAMKDLTNIYNDLIINIEKYAEESKKLREEIEYKYQDFLALSSEVETIFSLKDMTADEANELLKGTALAGLVQMDSHGSADLKLSFVTSSYSSWYNRSPYANTPYYEITKTISSIKKAHDEDNTLTLNSINSAIDTLKKFLDRPVKLSSDTYFEN